MGWLAGKLAEDGGGDEGIVSPLGRVGETYGLLQLCTKTVPLLHTAYITPCLIN